jgi:hypothetical protein
VDWKEFKEVVVNINEIFDKYNQKIHYVEDLLRMQSKVIVELKDQISHLLKNRESLIAPIDAICICCTIKASIVAKCGHYFCDLCVGRFHHEDCIQCEKNKASENE